MQKRFGHHSKQFKQSILLPAFSHDIDQQQAQKRPPPPFCLPSHKTRMLSFYALPEDIKQTLSIELGKFNELFDYSSYNDSKFILLND